LHIFATFKGYTQNSGGKELKHFRSFREYDLQKKSHGINIFEQYRNDLLMGCRLGVFSKLKARISKNWARIQLIAAGSAEGVCRYLFQNSQIEGLACFYIK